MTNCTCIPVEFIALAEVMVDLVEENVRGLNLILFQFSFFIHALTNVA